MGNEITVVIPTIPPRKKLLKRALKSVDKQLHQPYDVIVETDHEREGSAVVRTRAMMQVTTPWVAFLDDDDEMMPKHLKTLVKQADKADVIWTWFKVKGGRDPIAHNRGRQWDPSSPHLFHVTGLVRTSFAQQCSFISGFPRPHKKRSRDDWRFHNQLSNTGARFLSLPDITWIWYHHGSGNTSGLSKNW